MTRSKQPFPVAVAGAVLVAGVSFAVMASGHPRIGALIFSAVGGVVLLLVTERVK